MVSSNETMTTTGKLIPALHLTSNGCWIRWLRKPLAPLWKMKRIRELNDAAQGISYGNIHSGVHVRVNRFAEVDDQLIEQYEAISGPLLTISRQLQKTLCSS